LLLADYRHDYLRSVVLALDQIDPQAILKEYEVLESNARAELALEGIAADRIRFERQIDLKYGYQVAEMTMPFPKVSPDELRTRLAELFTQAHRQAFGYGRDDSIELVSLRLRALASAGQLSFSDLVGQTPQDSNTDGAAATRSAYFGPDVGACEAAIYRRVDLTQEQHGPLIVEEPDTTVVVPPGWRIQRDAHGNLTMRQ